MIQRKKNEKLKIAQWTSDMKFFNARVDLQIFEQELRASEKRVGGTNPSILQHDDDDPQLVSANFSFLCCQLPVRVVVTGTEEVKCKFLSSEENASEKIEYFIGSQYTTSEHPSCELTYLGTTGPIVFFNVLINP